MFAKKRKVIFRNVPVVYEDDSVVVVNKPAGLLVHSDGRSKETTLADYVARAYPGVISVGEPLFLNERGSEKIIPRPGVVHRLDRETSGVILFAKTEKAYEYLKRQFKRHEVKKTYLAIVHGHLKNDTGVITLPIARSRRDFRAKATPDFYKKDARGALREAITRYKIIERFFVKDGAKIIPLSYVEIFPETGRTHQIRVHFKSIRHPVYGDNLYGTKSKRSLEEKFGRTALHARNISFFTVGGKLVTAETQLPNDFRKFLAGVGVS